MQTVVRFHLTSSAGMMSMASMSDFHSDRTSSNLVTRSMFDIIFKTIVIVYCTGVAWWVLGYLMHAAARPEFKSNPVTIGELWGLYVRAFKWPVRWFPAYSKVDEELRADGRVD